MDDQVAALLRRAADAGGEFTPPDTAGLASRGRRRVLTRTALAVAAVVLLVVGLAVGLHFAGGGSTRPVAAPAGPPVGPSLSALEHGHWSTLPRAPLATRYPAVTVWTGSQLIVWGGANYDTRHGRFFDDGAAYTPATRSWQVLPKAPLESREDATFAWTGSVLFVWGGGSANGYRTDGATYDPLSRQWRLLPAPPIPDKAGSDAVAVDGKVVLISWWPGDSAAIHADEYDPASNRWTVLPDVALPPGHKLSYLATLGAGDRVFVWSMWAHNLGQGDPFPLGTDGYVLTPRTRTWRSAPIPAARGSDVGTPLWTGSRVLLLGEGPWCGDYCTPGPPRGFSGVSIDPRTGKRAAVAQPSTVNGARDPLSAGELSYDGNFVWTGSYVIDFVELAEKPNAPGGIAAAWDPRRNKWSELPKPPHHQGDSDAVWTGHSLLVMTADGTLLQFAPR